MRRINRMSYKAPIFSFYFACIHWCRDSRGWAGNGDIVWCCSVYFFCEFSFELTNNPSETELNVENEINQYNILSFFRFFSQACLEVISDIRYPICIYFMLSDRMAICFRDQKYAPIDMSDLWINIVYRTDIRSVYAPCCPIGWLFALEIRNMHL